MLYDSHIYDTLMQLEKLCGQTALRRSDNRNLTFEISANDMRTLDSIFTTIESIKKRYPPFNIKVASVRLQNFNEGDDKKLFDLLTAYKVAELNVVNVDK